MVVVLLMVALVLLGVTPTHGYFTRSGRRILDSFGRERIFHGVNVVVKQPPYLPTTEGFDVNSTLGPQDWALLQSWGFNMLRLGTMWAGVLPAPGAVNHTYLAALDSIVQQGELNGIAVLLDLHQDLMSRFFCGEGAPDYLINPPPHFSLAAFPMPVTLKPYKADPYPSLEDCYLKPFADYYPTGAVGKAFQQLYENANGFQDALVLYWQTVSSHFQASSNVLGYELLNEPWVGDIFDYPHLLIPGVTDAKYLAPMYDRLFKAIRGNDTKHMIFFESTVQDASNGFSRVPANDSNAVYSYHVYCASEGRDDDFCKGTLELLFYTKNGDAKRLNIPGFMTEFGAVADDPFYVELQVALQDSALASWSYWQYKFFGDITTSAPGGGNGDLEGLWFPNGTLQKAKVKSLSRTYPEATQGQLQQFVFDPVSGDFTMVYVADATIAAPTQIFVSLEFYYDNGFTVSITPASAAIWRNSTLLQNRIEVMAIQNVVISLQIKGR